MYYLETANAFETREQQARETLLSKVLIPSPVFTLHDKCHAERAEVEVFITDKFRDSYGAEVHEFMPLLLSMSCLERRTGAIGMRKAAGNPLFLERYLDGNIETVMSDELDTPVNRVEIVEIGNLVAGRKGPSQFIFMMAMTALYEAGYKWITFTATRTLANNLDKLGFPMTRLAEASIDRLSEEEAQEWGSYYQTQPQVYAGSLAAATAIARKRPLFRKAMAMYRREIRRLAGQIREH